MADRSGAEMFAKVFQIIANHVPEGQREALALEMWELQRNYDFSPYQMCADEALFTLGLARRGVDPDWPNDGEVVLYGPASREEGTTP